MAWREGRKRAGGMSLDLRLTPDDRTGGPARSRADSARADSGRRRDPGPPRPPKKRKSGGKSRIGFSRIVYWGFVLATALFAYVVVVTVGNPVRLVTIVAILSLCVAPIYYGLNYYCVTRFIKQDEFRPKMPARAVALLGIVVMFLATLLYAGSKLKLIK